MFERSYTCNRCGGLREIVDPPDSLRWACDCAPEIIVPSDEDDSMPPEPEYNPEELEEGF